MLSSHRWDPRQSPHVPKSTLPAAFVATLLLAACGAATGSARLVPATPPRPSATAQAAAPTASGAGGDPLPLVVYQGSTLATARIDGTEVTPLFRSDMPPSPAHADWSPDGGRITFQAGVDGSWDIWVAEADGSGARILVDCVSRCINLDSPAWSPDGRLIAYSELDESGDELQARLQTVDVQSGNVESVLAVERGVSLTEPRWSSDGASLAVTVEDHRQGGDLVEHPVASRIAVIRPDDAKPSLRYLTDPSMKASYADWSPSGDRIAFSAGEKTWWDDIDQTTANVFTIGADGRGLAQVTHLGPSDPAIWMPAWSSDGSTILATQTNWATRDNRIVRVAVDGPRIEEVGIDGAHAREQRSPRS